MLGVTFPVKGVKTLGTEIELDTKREDSDISSFLFSLIGEKAFGKYCNIRSAFYANPKGTDLGDLGLVVRYYTSFK